MKSRNYIYCVGMMSGSSQSTPHAASGSRMRVTQTSSDALPLTKSAKRLDEP